MLKDTGRVLQMPYGQVDRLAKAIPNHPTDPWTLKRARRRHRAAAEYRGDAQVRRLLTSGVKLEEGLPRHARPMPPGW